MFKRTSPKSSPFPFQFLGTPFLNQATHKIVECAYHGVVDSLAAMDKMARAGQTHPVVRRYAEEVIRKVYPKDYLSELAAIYYDVCRRIRYTRDPAEREYVQHPVVILENRSADCFAEGTLFLNDKFELVPVEKTEIGTRIWGYNHWSVVENVWAKGVLPVDAIRLNNGAWISLTTNHKVYVAHCPIHQWRDSNHAQKASADESSDNVPCSCGLEAREVRRVTVSQLELGDVLLTPEQSPLGTEARHDLGTDPVQRLTARMCAKGRKYGYHELLRVAEIVRAAEEVPVWDVTTDDHYVYLPEADVTVSNCDDQAVLIRAALGALGLSVGNPVEFVTVGFDKSAPRGRRFTHVFLRALDAKSGQWVVMDPVAGPNTADMLAKAKVFAIKKV